jgi:hypothetical protein
MDLNSSRRGFRLLPGRWSWKSFVCWFAAFLALNSAIAAYVRRKPLSHQNQEISQAVAPIRVALELEAQEIRSVRSEVAMPDGDTKPFSEITKGIRKRMIRRKAGLDDVEALLGAVDRLAVMNSRQQQTLTKAEASVLEAAANLKQLERATLKQAEAGDSSGSNRGAR